MSKNISIPQDILYSVNVSHFSFFFFIELQWFVNIVVITSQFSFDYIIVPCAIDLRFIWNFRKCYRARTRKLHFHDFRFQYMQIIFHKVVTCLEFIIIAYFRDRFVSRHFRDRFESLHFFLSLFDIWFFWCIHIFVAKNVIINPSEKLNELLLTFDIPLRSSFENISSKSTVVM